MFGAVALLCVVLRIVWAVARPRVRGALGEKLLAAILRKGLDASLYRMLNDVYLPLSDGTTTQIDHVVVSTFGVFVIETKTYKGWIFGRASDVTWTQGQYGQNSTFPNPLIQNKLHVRRVVELLGLRQSAVRSVVAFSGEATFKTELPDEVMHFAHVAGYIRSFTAETIPLDAVDGIAAEIMRLHASIPPDVRKAHVRNLRKRKHGK